MEDRICYKTRSTRTTRSDRTAFPDFAKGVQEANAIA